MRIGKPAIKRPREQTARKNHALRLGEPAPCDEAHNCLSCSRWVSCRDTRKSYMFRCTRYDAAILDGDQDYDDLLAIMSKDGTPRVAADDPIDTTSEVRLLDMIDSALNSNSPIPPDIRIKDESIPKAKNIYEWLTSDKFAFVGMNPFPRQIYMGAMLYADFCPRCSDVDWFETMPVGASLSKLEGKVVFLEHGKCPECGARRRKLVRNGELDNPLALVGIIGQRSGKTATSVLFEGYNQHRFLKLSAPNRVYNTLPQNLFTSTYTANTFGQARVNIWSQYDALLSNAPWFRRYHAFLDRRGEELGEELYAISEIFVKYRHRNYMISPASPSMRTMRGQCVVGGTLINTNEGFVRADELINDEGYIPVSGLSIDGPHGPRSVSHTYKAKGSVIRLKTRNGFQLSATPEHPVLVFTQDLRFVWRTMDSLKEGDWIVSTTKFNKPQYGDSAITKAHAGWLGYWVANGVPDGRIFSKDGTIIRRIIKCGRRMLSGAIPVIKTAKSGVKSIAFSDNATGKRMKPSFATLFVPDEIRGNAYSKAIPHAVRTAKKEVLHEFLEAYFACDGYVTGGKMRGDTVVSPAKIVLSSASQILIDQLHNILHHGYGILGRKKSYHRRHEDMPHLNRYDPNRTVYHLHEITITGSDAIMFLQKFKRAKVQRQAHRFSFDAKPGDHNDRRTIPYARQAIAEAFDQARCSTTKGNTSKMIELVTGERVYNLRRMQPKCFGRRNRNLITEVPEYLVYEDDWKAKLPWLRLVSPVLADRIQTLLKYRPHMEQVTYVGKGKNEVAVYDVTVPDGHAFTANSLTVHNTRFTAMVDEISWMRTQRSNGKEIEQANAKETYKALYNSLDTIRAGYLSRFDEGYDDLPKPIIYAISSPSQINDYGMILYRSSLASREMLGLKYATWDFNPLQPKKNYAERLRLSPLETMRDFGCEPPIGTSTFLTDTDAILNAFGDKKNLFKVKQGTGRAKSGRKVIRAKLDGLRAMPNLRWGCILTLDVGLSDNSFSFAVSTVPNDFELEDYLDQDYENEDVERETIPVQVLFVGEVIPRDGLHLSISAIYRDILSPLCELLPIQLIGSDRWQNVKIVQDLEDAHGVAYEEIRLNWDDFSNFRDALYDGAIELPRTEATAESLMEVVIEDYPFVFMGKPIEHLAYQMMTVQESRGRTVIKGDATDDMFRCIVLANTMINDLGLVEDLILEEETAPVKNGPIGIVGRGGGGRSEVTKPGEAAPVALLSRRTR